MQRHLSRVHRVEQLRVRDAVAALLHRGVIAPKRAIEPRDELEASHRARRRRRRRRRRRGVARAALARRRVAGVDIVARGAAAFARANGERARVLRACGARLRLTTRAPDVRCDACGRAHALEEGATRRERRDDDRRRRGKASEKERRERRDATTRRR